jgi:hypothetical protein
VNARKLSAVVGLGVTAAMVVAIFMIAMNVGRADHAPYFTPEGVIIYGDWGLYRPGHVRPWAEGPVVIGAGRFGMGHYFPTNRNDPGAYRRRPKEPGPVIVPAQPYYRSWGAQSQNPDPNSATVYAPFEPPAVIYAPRLDRVPHPQPHPHK